MAARDCGSADIKFKMRQRLASLLGITIVSFLLAGCNIPLFSYPHLWDFTKTKPDEASLVVSYKILRVSLPGDLARAVRANEPSIKLSANHSAVLTNYPEFDGFGETLICRNSSSVTWKLSGYDNSGWKVAYTIERRARDAGSPECGEGTSFLTMLGRQAPYRLYLTVGDPDSNAGIDFERIPD